MLKFFAFGAGTGAGIQAWRNFPADGPVTAAPLAVVFALGIVGAFLGGLWLHRGRGHSASAFASAHASAEASSVSSANQSIQLAVILPGSGAGATAAGRIPSEAAPWLTGADRLQVTADDLDGIDLSELVPDSTPEAAG